MNERPYGTRRWRPAPLAAALVVALCINPAAHGETTNTEPSQENAATGYWRAIALLDHARTAEELELVSFIDEDMAPFAPGILSIRPDANRWLLNQSPALLSMGRAGQLPTCHFDVRWPGDIGLNLQHLAPLKRLSHRALQAAKAYEYVENQQGAATIYVSLLQLAKHLDQDLNTKSGIFAAELLQRILDGLVGFVSRNPPPKATDILKRYFAEAPPTLLHLNAYLDADAEACTQWLTEQPDEAEKRLASLYGNVMAKPAVDRLMTLERDRKIERLTEWVDDYQARMKALSEATTKPYRLGVYELQEMDDERKVLKDASPEEITNPLIPLLVPAMEKTYERFLLAEGHFIMADVVCSAASYRAHTKEWPKSIEDLSKFMGRSFRRDPYTGQTIQYALKGGYPVVLLRAPRWLAKQPDILFRVNLGTRLKQDQEKLADMAEAFSREKRQEKIRDLHKAVEK